MEPQEKSKLYKFLKIDAILENLTALIEARLELAKLEIKEEVAKLGAKIIAGVVFAFLLVMIVIFLSISLATWINYLLESVFLGYVIVTGFCIVVLALLIAFKTRIWLQKKIEAMLIESEETNHEDEQGSD